MISNLCTSNRRKELSSNLANPEGLFAPGKLLGVNTSKQICNFVGLNSACSKSSCHCCLIRPLSLHATGLSVGGELIPSRQLQKSPNLTEDFLLKKLICCYHHHPKILFLFCCRKVGWNNYS